MKKVRHLLLLAVAGLWLLPAASRADYILKDAMIGYLSFSPQFDFYEGAWGIEGEIHRWKWQDEKMGLSTLLGAHTWHINKRPPQVTAVQEISSVEGTVSYLVAGLSWLYRAEPADRFRVTFELGSRINFGLTSATANVPLPNGNTTRGGGIDIGSQITGIGTVNGEFEVNEDWKLTLGGGYQVDIIQGEISYRGQTIADNELAGPFFRLGVLFEY